MRRSVLSKAPLRSAFLKTRRICVKYSHNNWYIKWGQAIITNNGKIVFTYEDAKKLIGICKSTFRDAIDELRYVADRWRMDYNHYRLHSSLNYMAPAVFVAKCPEESGAFLKTRRICVKYSHNNWYKKWGQAICSIR